MARALKTRLFPLCLSLLVLSLACSSRTAGPKVSGPKTVQGPVKPPVGGPIPAEAVPKISLEQVALDCLDPECFGLKNFPAISHNGARVIDLVLEDTSDAIAGAPSDYTTMTVLVREVATGKVQTELKLVEMKDHFDALHNVQEKACIREVVKSWQGDPHLCPRDPALVKAYQPRFLTRFRERLAPIEAELRSDAFEGMVEVPDKAGEAKPGSGMNFVREAEGSKVTLRVFDIPSGQVLAEMTHAFGGGNSEEQAPEFSNRVHYSVRHRLFLFSLIISREGSSQGLYQRLVRRSSAAPSPAP